MAICVDVNNAGRLVEEVLQPAETCTAYLLQTAAEYQHLNSLDSLFSQYLSVDSEFTVFVMTAYFVSFLSGHILGRIVSSLRKAG